jgi:hypothetical protein
MTRWLALILFFAAVFAVSLLGTVAGRFFTRPPARDHQPVAVPQGGHLGNNDPWLHKQLNLTEEQKVALRTKKVGFEAQEVRLERLMAEAQDDLSKLIRQEQHMSPAVQECLGRINGYHGELQRITLEHLFDTYANLDDSRRLVLLDLTSAALRDPLEKFESRSATPTEPSP